MVTRWLYGYKDTGYMVIWLTLLNGYKVVIWLQGCRVHGNMAGIVKWLQGGYMVTRIQGTW